MVSTISLRRALRATLLASFSSTHPHPRRCMASLAASPLFSSSHDFSTIRTATSSPTTPPVMNRGRYPTNHKLHRTNLHNTTPFASSFALNSSLYSDRRDLHDKISSFSDTFFPQRRSLFPSLNSFFIPFSFPFFSLSSPHRASSFSFVVPWSTDGSLSTGTKDPTHSQYYTAARFRFLLSFMRCWAPRRAVGMAITWTAMPPHPSSPAVKICWSNGRVPCGAPPRERQGEEAMREAGVTHTRCSLPLSVAKFRHGNIATLSGLGAVVGASRRRPLCSSRWSLGKGNLVPPTLLLSRRLFRVGDGVQDVPEGGTIKEEVQQPQHDDGREGRISHTREGGSERPCCASSSSAAMLHSLSSSTTHAPPQYRVVTITEKKRLSGERVAFRIDCDPYEWSESSVMSSTCGGSLPPFTHEVSPPSAAPMGGKEKFTHVGKEEIPPRRRIPSEDPSPQVPSSSSASPTASSPFRFPSPSSTLYPARPRVATSTSWVPSPAMVEPVKRVLFLRCGPHVAQGDKTSLLHMQDWRIPLLPEGRAASKEMGKNLSELIAHEPVYIYHSPYTRAREVVEEVIKGLEEGSKAREHRERENEREGARVPPQKAGTAPPPRTSSQIIGIREDARLRGGDMGRYDHVEEMLYHMSQCEKYGPFFYRFPHGESGADVCDRITSFLGSFQRERLDLEPNTNVLLVSHDIVIRMFMKRWFHLNVDTFHQMRTIPPSSLITLTRVHHQPSFRLNEECVEMLGLPLSLNEHNGYRYRNKSYLGSMSSGAPFM